MVSSTARVDRVGAGFSVSMVGLLGTGAFFPVTETAPEYLEQLQELEKSLEQNHNAACEISLVCSPNSVFLTIVTDCSYLFQLLITVMPRTHWPLV